MLGKNVLHRGCSIAASALTLLLASPSQATVWSGSWDPQYGAPFTTGDGFAYDLGWGGDIKVNDDACAVTPGATISNAGDCIGGAFVVAGSLVVRLYDIVTPTQVLNTLVFNSASFIIDQLRYDSSGKLTGISTTGISNWVYDSSSIAAPNGAGTDAEFAIQFVLDGLPCFDCSNFGALPGNYDGPVLFAGRNFDCGDDGDEPCDFYRSNVADFPARINFTPEPASVALVAMGLLAAGVARRRLAVAKPDLRV
jgi:hypothetical protein